MWLGTADRGTHNLGEKKPALFSVQKTWTANKAKLYPITSCHQTPPLILHADPVNGCTFCVGALPPKTLKIIPPRPSVLDPTTTSVAAAASEIGVPDTVITAPGTSVWVPITKSDAEFAVYVDPANVKILLEAVVRAYELIIAGRMI